MTPLELARQAERVLADGLKYMQLVTPRQPGNGRRMVVMGGRGTGLPRLLGEPCCVNSSGQTVVAVEAMDVLAWLAAAGLIEVRTASGESLTRGGAT